MADTVRLDVDDDGVATVTVDRPDQLNALNVPTLEALGDAVAEAAERDARALVLTGAGEKAFVAGADISYMVEMDAQDAREYADLGHDVASAVEAFPAPAIAAINGYAFGGGMEFALACDLRVASERAVMGQTEVDLGIIPGWGATQRLPRLVDDETARRLVFFGDRLDATDAHEEGLVGEVVAHDELREHVDDLAHELAAQPASALRAAKDAINQSYETDLAAGLDYERERWAGLFGGHDQREGMRAFLEDRDPDFE